jgi:hypothetical protein
LQVLFAAILTAVHDYCNQKVTQVTSLGALLELWFLHSHLLYSHLCSRKSRGSQLPWIIGPLIVCLFLELELKTREAVYNKGRVYRAVWLPHMYLEMQNKL